MMKIEFVTASDWIAMYVDGVKVVDGHSLAYFHILDALGLPYEDARYIECDDEKEWINFAEKIEDVKLHKYDEAL
jgi:hypothetical protein